MATETTKHTSSGHGSREHGDLDTRERNDLPESAFAYPRQRKEPLNDAEHVRNALARFDQVEGVTDEEREAAFKRIEKAGEKFGVEIKEKSWRDLGRKPHGRNPSQ